MKHIHALIAAFVMGAASTASALNSFSLNFDSQASGTAAQASAPAGFHINFGVRVPELDSNGDETGRQIWQLDSGTVLAQNPSTFAPSYGTAPSGTNAMNAVDQDVLFTFDQPYNLTSFGTILDNSTFGFDGFKVEFYDASDNLLTASSNVQETTPLYSVSMGAVNGVSKIAIPNGAFYDNVSVQGATAVPEPSAVLSVITGAAMLLGFRRRRP